MRAPAGSRVPDFFVVGHAKTGTTALHAALRSHPELYLPEFKEPMFLASDMPLLGPAPPGLPQTLDDYLRLFEPASPAQIVGEISPLYLLSGTAPRNIFDLNPEAKLVAIFREPVAFVRSFHLESVQIGNEDQVDLGRALELEDERRRGRNLPRGCYRPGLLLYSDHVRYTEQLERYRALFPAERVLVLVYEDFVADYAGTVRRILEHLEVDAEVDLPRVDANPTVGVRSPRLVSGVAGLWTGGHPLARAVRRGSRAAVPGRLRLWIRRSLLQRVVYTSAPPVDPELEGRLRDRFRPEVERFADYLGRDLLEVWGYR